VSDELQWIFSLLPSAGATDVFRQSHRRPSPQGVASFSCSTRFFPAPCAIAWKGINTVRAGDFAANRAQVHPTTWNAEVA